MSKAAKVLSYSNKFPTLSQWTKNFKYRNSTSPRSTIGNPKITGKRKSKETSRQYAKWKIAPALEKLNLKNINNMTAVELNPGIYITCNNTLYK